MMPRKKVKNLILLSMLLGSVAGIIILSQRHIRTDFYIVLSFFVIIFSSFFHLITSVRRTSFSMNMMFWLFSFFFYGIAPLLQFYTNTYAWNFEPQQDELLKTNIYILIWFISYSVGWNIKLQSAFKKNGNKLKRYDCAIHYRIEQSVLNILLAISMSISLYYLITVGPSNLVSRAAYANEDLDKMMSLLIQHGFRNTVLFTCVLSFVLANKRQRLGYEQVISIICMLISCFPTGMARNMMASFYAGLLIIVIGEKRKKAWMTYAIIFGLILVFPPINIFRHFSNVSKADIYSSIIRNIATTYLSGDYDAHQMFISIQRYVLKSDFSYGNQLMGAIFFFIPRSIWNSKPYGTGQTAFMDSGQHWFTNVSAPLIAEAWVNYGIIGIILGGILLGYIVRRIDRRYWGRNGELSYIHVMYPFLVFMFFFIQRGDLMTTWAYTCAQLFVCTVIYTFAVRKERVLIRKEILPNDKDNDAYESKNNC